jgi:hypothetical protein
MCLLSNNCYPIFSKTENFLVASIFSTTNLGFSMVVLKFLSLSVLIRSWILTPFFLEDESSGGGYLCYMLWIVASNDC